MPATKAVLAHLRKSPLDWKAGKKALGGGISGAGASGAGASGAGASGSLARLGGSLLVELAALLQLLVQLALGGELEDQVDARLIVKVAIQPQDVGVAQVRLDLDLSAELVLDARLAQLRFIQHLERHDVLGVLFPCEVDVAELSLA